MLEQPLQQYTVVKRVVPAEPLPADSDCPRQCRKPVGGSRRP
jgi:hypothetical protein